MRYKIVADSSANLLDDVNGIAFTSAQFVMHVDETMYEDNRYLDVHDFVETLKKTKGKTSTACPGVSAWFESFGDAEVIVALALTSKISGAYNAALAAAAQYMDEYPGRKVHVVDTLTTGPELEVLAEKCADLMKKERSFEEIVKAIEAYKSRTHLNFMLERLDNFARNGRVNAAVAKAVGFLGIRIVGRASAEGELEPIRKCKGSKRGIAGLFDSMKECGYAGGKVRIRHSMNQTDAEALQKLIKSEFPQADATVAENRGLCAYYAEYGGVLVGFES